MSIDDCCPGEPCMGDPRGMHSFDCPVYLKWADAHEAAQRERFRAERRRPPSVADLIWRAGYRQGYADAPSPSASPKRCAQSLRYSMSGVCGEPIRLVEGRWEHVTKTNIGHAASPSPSESTP